MRTDGELNRHFEQKFKKNEEEKNIYDPSTDEMITQSEHERRQDERKSWRIFNATP
jgi:hypothetical protein